jgi:hydroxypyruvate isomerase
MKTIDRRHVLGSAAALALAARARAREGQDAAADPAELARIGKTPHTRFAVNCEIWWKELPFLERVAKTAEYGFPAIEFWPWRGKDLAALERATKDLGLAVAQFTAWGFEPGMNDPANHARVVDEVREGCAVANRLACKAMTVVAGNDQPGMTRERMHEHVIAALKLCAPVARDHGVTLILEPMNGRVDHPGHCLYGSEAALRIVRAVDSPFVEINWDLYHMQLAEGDLCGRLKDGIEWLGYAQVADTPGRHEPGTGEIHYPRVLRALHELGYRGFVGLECWPLEGEHRAALRVAAADAW